MPLYFLNTGDAAGPGGETPVSSPGTPQIHRESRPTAAGNEDCGPSDPPVFRRGADPSNRLFAWSVATGLALLVAWLAPVLASAGLSVEVLP